MNEQEEVKQKKVFLEFLTREIIFSGDPQQIEDRKFYLVNEMYRIFKDLAKKSY